MLRTLCVVILTAACFIIIKLLYEISMWNCFLKPSEAAERSYAALENIADNSNAVECTNETDEEKNKDVKFCCFCIPRKKVAFACFTEVDNQKDDFKEEEEGEQ